MQVQYILEILGTAFFAASGALVANHRSTPDWFGATFISFVTATGGGSMRDILLGSYPLGWVRDVNFIYAVLAGLIITALFYHKLKNWKKIFFVFDSLGIAMFTIIGTQKALGLGVAPPVAAILGMFSAVMGGILRDVLSNEEPIIFKKEIYATACLAGALVYLGLEYLQVEKTVAFLTSFGMIFIIRYVAVKYHLSLPRFVRNTEE